MASGVGSRSGIEAGRAYVSLGIFSAEFEKGLRGAQQKMDAFGTNLTKSFSKVALGASIAFTGIAVGLRTITKDAVQLYRMSLAMGISIKMLSGMRYQAQLLGVSMEDIDSGLTQFRNRLTQASLGSKEAIRNFETIGVAWQDLIKLSPEEQIYSLGDAFERLNATQKLGASRVFGDVGRKILPVIDSIGKKIGEANRLGITMTEEQIKAFLKLNRYFVTLSAQGMSAFYQMTVQLSGVIKELAIAFGFVIKYIRQFIEANPKFSSFVMYSLGAVVLLTGSLTILGHTFKLVASGMSPFISVIGLFTKKVGEATNGFRLFYTMGRMVRFEINALKMPFNLLNSAYTKIGSGVKFLGGGKLVGAVGKSLSGPLDAVMSALGPVIKLLSPIIGVVGPVLGSIGAILGPILAVVGPIVLIGGTVFLIISGLKHIGQLFGMIVDGVKAFAKGVDRASGGALRGLLDTMVGIKDVIVGMMAKNKWDEFWKFVKLGGTLVMLQLRDTLFGTFLFAAKVAKNLLFNSEFWSSGFAVVWTAFLEGFWTSLDLIISGLKTALPFLAPMLPSERQTVSGREYKAAAASGVDPFTGRPIDPYRGNKDIDVFENRVLSKALLRSRIEERADPTGNTISAEYIDLWLKYGKLERGEIKSMYLPSLADEKKYAQEDLEHQRRLALKDTAIIANPRTTLQGKIDVMYDRMNFALQDLQDVLGKAVDAADKESDGKPPSDTAKAQKEFNDFVKQYKIVEEELKDLGAKPPPLPSPEEMKREFESYGTFSAFGLGQIGFGTSVQEKIASGIEKLVDGQSETNSILSNMEPSTF